MNVSNEISIWCDSGWHVQRNVIQEILKKRNDYHFFLTVPYNQLSKVVSLSSPLLTFMPYHYSGGAGNKYHFDSVQLWKLMDMRHKDWDFVINNEAILGNHFLNMFCYRSHFDIPIVNYVHWVNTTKDMTHQQMDMLNSISWCYNTYCNSKYGRELILKEVDNIYSDVVAEKIKNNLHILNVGFNDKEMLEYKVKDKFDKVTLIFNHRVSQYTGFSSLLKQCKKIYDNGTDFQLIFTNPATPMARGSLKKYPFVTTYDEPLSYPDYIRLLWKSDICFGLHNGQNQWSIAFLEALYCDNIPITTNDIFYKEMLDRKTHQLEDLGFVIENIDSIRENYSIEKYYWRNLVDDYIKMYETNFEQHGAGIEVLKNPENSTVLRQIKSFFNTRPILEKQEIIAIRGKTVGSGIGCQVPYTKYRKELLKVADDVIEEEKSFYRIKDESNVSAKTVDWWMK